MVSCFLSGNEELILGFADCLGVLVSVLFCESDERLSQFYHQILGCRHLLKIKCDSERRLCTNVSEEDISVGALKVTRNNILPYKIERNVTFVEGFE